MSMYNDELSGIQKAAILLISLGPEKSANIFKHLKEDEIEALTLEIANTRSVLKVVSVMLRNCLIRHWERKRQRM